MSDLMPIALVAALLTMLYLALAVNVVRVRYRYRQSLGVPEGDDAQRAIRAHANFNEYVPLSLVLIALMPFLGAPTVLIQGLCIALLASRCAHAFSLLVAEPRYHTLRWRQVGMVLGFGILLVAAGFLLWQLAF